MAFYDFFLSNKSITLLGQRWMKQAAEYTLHRLSQVLAPLERVVEIGPGLGALTLACRERGLDYAAIDANIGLLHQLKPANGVCSFVPLSQCATLPAMPLLQDTFLNIQPDCCRLRPSCLKCFALYVLVGVL